MNFKNETGASIAKLAVKDPNVRESIEAQFIVSTNVRYNIRIRLRPDWPAGEKSDLERHFQKVHMERIEIYAAAMEKSIKNDLKKRDNKLIVSLNELLDKNSEISISMLREIVVAEESNNES